MRPLCRYKESMREESHVLVDVCRRPRPGTLVARRTTACVWTAAGRLQLSASDRALCVNVAEGGAVHGLYGCRTRGKDQRPYRCPAAWQKFLRCDLARDHCGAFPEWLPGNCT